MIRTALPALCALMIAGVNAGNYVIIAPQNIQPGSAYKIAVDILNATDVKVTATLREQKYNGYTGRYEYKELQNVSGTFDSGSPGKLIFSTEPDLRCESCQVLIKGDGGLEFEQLINAYVNTQVTVTLVQTDKAIYKPGQTVRFRVFAVHPDLQLYKGLFNIEIRDPNSNRIKVLTNVSSPSGVVEDSLKLSDQPPFGTWFIDVVLEGILESYSQSFEVSQYELPRYEVTVQLPPYVLIKDAVLTGKVKAKYTFGEPVKGFVELYVGPNQGPNACGELPRSTQIGFEINGEADFSIPKEDIDRAVMIYNQQEVKVTAFVKEDATGVRLNGSSTVTWYSNNYQIKFAENTPSVFKPGLPYTAFIQVTTPDNKPPTDNNITVSVYTCVTYQLTLNDQALYDTAQFTGTYGLPGKNVTIPESGLLAIDIDIPSNATSISIKASLSDVSASKTVEKMHSQSNNFIQLAVLDKNVKSGSTVHIEVEGTEALNEVVFEVLARGSVADSGVVNGQGQRSFNFTLLVTPEYAPTAHLLVYYTRNPVEIVADSLAFNVQGIFKNDVKISFNKNESEPNKNVSVEVTAAPNSEVYLLAVDQSVLLLKTGNDITTDKVNKAMYKFDKSEKPSDSEFALSYSATGVQEVFTKNGLQVFTDVYIPYPPSRYERLMHRGSYGLQGSPGPYAMRAYHSEPVQMTLMKGDIAPLKDVEKVRQFFPEVWLWASVGTRDNGTAFISALVPDTITSWIASSFATHSSIGLGVAPVTADLKVFRPFFVSLTHPNTVKRGEQVVIQAVVFNYLPDSMSVTVTLKGSSKFQSIKSGGNGLEIHESGDQVQTVQVDSKKQGVAYFPIHCSEISVIDIEVSAQSSVAADAVRNQMIVEAEGAPVSFNYPIFVNLAEKGNFQETINFTLPNSLVNGSDSARIKVTGDLIGSSLDSLDSLLQLPTGCGEQSGVKLAPNVYVGQYLTATGQLTEAIKKKIIDYLEAGYQRQLTYQRSDGGFSAFGNTDDSGSTWVTAYITCILSGADKFIYSDPRVRSKGVEWLIERQNKDGSFNEFGKVLDSSIQGTGTGPALTAFVLLTFIENKNLSTLNCVANFECYKSYQWGNATVNAVKNLEGLLDKNSINDQFSLALVSYALTLAGSSRAEVALKKLETFAHKDGGLLYWSDNSTAIASQGSHYRTWRPPRIQSRPIDIRITSYAILTYTALDRIPEALPAVLWLTKERNPSGGFVSSQDTSLALQALAAYASKSVRPDTNLNVKVFNDVTLAEFHVTKNNALVLQIKELSHAPPKANIAVDGTGFALVEVVIKFNVNKELSTPSFDVSTVLLDDDLDSFNLMICTKWLWDWSTGMVVQDISIPSGFTPDLSSLGNVAGLRRSERKGNTVSVYFDKISKTSVCYSIRMTRTDKVARTQENHVVTRDYYNPRDQSTVFWQPTKLRDSTYCDVCPRCCQ